MPNRLAEVLQETGRRKDWFAGQLGVTPSHLSHILAGRRPLPARLKSRAAAILNVPESYLFGDSDIRPVALPPEREALAS